MDKLMRLPQKKRLSDLFAGFSTALFSIPEGIAYAKLAGVDPLYGLFSSMVATIAASLTVSTALMVSTLTSAIAISTKSVLEVAGIASHELSQALFTLTFLMGLFMLFLGFFKLGKLVHFVSNAVMTGFVLGASMLIILGELGDLVGIELVGASRLEKLLFWLKSWDKWDPLTAAVGVSAIFLMLLLQKSSQIGKMAAAIVIVITTAVVKIGGLDSVLLVGSLAKFSSGLPAWSPPDFALMPRLMVGAVAVSLVSLFQGAGIRSAFPSKTGKESSLSRDFIGIGLGNFCGSFFQSMGTGGSLSRTAVCVQSGAESRWASFFSGVLLIVMVGLFAHYLQYIPIAAIGGILVVIAMRIIARQMGDVKLIINSSYESGLAMGATFFAALFIPLQWTIFLGALISFLFYLYTSATEVRFCQLIRDQEGYFEERPLPKELPSNQVTVLDFEGNLFFAQVPVARDLMPSIEDTRHAVMIWRIRGQEDVHSTFLSWMGEFFQQFSAAGNRFILEGVEPEVMHILEKTGFADRIGKENIFLEKPGIGQSLQEAYQSGVEWIEEGLPV